MDNLDLNKGNINPSQEGSKVDIAELSKQTGVPEKFLKAKLTGEETHSEALTKIIQIDYNAERKITEQGNILAEKDKQLRDFTQRTLGVDDEVVKTPPLDTHGVDMSKVDEIVTILKDSKKTKEDVEASKEMLRELQEEIQVTREQNQGTANQFLGTIRQQQYREGYKNLETRVGEEIAKKYFDLQNPDNTVIGKVISGDLGDERQKAWAKGVRQSAFLTEDPIGFIFRNVASPEERIKYDSTQPPQVEGAGGRVQSGKTSDTTVKGVAKFMNIEIKD